MTTIRQNSVHAVVGTQLPSSPTTVPLLERPALAPNVQLVGEMQETGFTERQWLLQRDGQFIQVTELLYRVAEHADGSRTLDEIAAGVTAATEWDVSADNVRHLIQTKLLPMGLIAPAGDAIPKRIAATRDNRNGSPLGLNARTSVLSPRVIDPITEVLQVFFAPPILALVLVIVAVAHGWLYFVHGVASGVRDALYAPGRLLGVVALLVLAGIIHEFGHAAALRYGGGRVRGMGVGIYLIYPAFYTDVTDSYRLGRWGRVRTDLGGFYFYLIFALATIGGYLITGWEFLLFVVVLINLDIVRQTLPFVRLDGYWALADLTGIPDPFSQMGPFLRSLKPDQSGGNRLPNLKPWVKRIFIAYIALTIPVLALLLYLFVKHAPRILGILLDALQTQMEEFSQAWGAGDALRVTAALAQMLILALELLGIMYLLVNLARRTVTSGWAWSKPTPARRAAGVLGAGLGVALLAYLWIPQLPEGSEDGPAGAQRFESSERTHVEVPVTYAQNPPVAGNHAPIWQNCGFYDAPIGNENAVHSLEHGAVWITYRPDLLAEQVDALRRLTEGQTHVLVSPYPNLPAPVVASAWDRQLLLDAADDARIEQFVRAFQRGSQAPEAGAPCSGGIGQPT